MSISLQRELPERSSTLAACYVDKSPGALADLYAGRLLGGSRLGAGGDATPEAIHLVSIQLHHLLIRLQARGNKVRSDDDGGLSLKHSDNPVVIERALNYIEQPCRIPVWESRLSPEVVHHLQCYNALEDRDRVNVICPIRRQEHLSGHRKSGHRRWGVEWVDSTGDYAHQLFMEV